MNAQLKKVQTECRAACAAWKQPGGLLNFAETDFDQWSGTYSPASTAPNSLPACRVWLWERHDRRNLASAASHRWRL